VTGAQPQIVREAGHDLGIGTPYRIGQLLVVAVNHDVALQSRKRPAEISHGCVIGYLFQRCNHAVPGFLMLVYHLITLLCRFLDEG
jgi:hypothetical protein